MVFAWVVIGTIFFIWAWRALQNLQNEKKEKWSVFNKKDKALLIEKKDLEEKFSYFYCF